MRGTRVLDTAIEAAFASTSSAVQAATCTRPHAIDLLSLSVDFIAPQACESFVLKGEVRHRRAARRADLYVLGSQARWRWIEVHAEHDRWRDERFVRGMGYSCASDEDVVGS